MFTAALFTIAKTWKQPQCPLTEEWIGKIWYIYMQCNITWPSKRNIALCHNKDRLRSDYTKQVN